MDLGDFAYLIFLAIAGLINFWNRKNKKKAKKPTKQKSQSIEDLISMWVDKKPEEAVAEPVSVDDQTNQWNFKTEPTTQPNNVEEAFYKKNERYKTTKKTPEKKVLAIEEQEEITEGIEFDVREAIIYSEILRRPDF